MVDPLRQQIHLNRLSQKPGPPQRSDGVPFFVFRSHPSSSTVAFSPKIVSAIKAMQSRSAMVLELAATIHWLAFVERFDDWREELLKRKGAKTEQGRSDDALRLLAELNIAPSNSG
jgi:hypothetical protein